jgi:hypothetical protein
MQGKEPHPLPPQDLNIAIGVGNQDSED